MPRSRARQLNLNNADVDDVENAEWAKARGDFAVYRKVIRREMLWDWWPQEVSEKLQQFYKDLKDGKRPKVAIMAPPQHGKSTAATDFITWVAGQDPNLKTIFASFSDTLGGQGQGRRHDGPNGGLRSSCVRLGSQAWRCERQFVCCLAYRQERREARARA